MKIRTALASDFNGILQIAESIYKNIENKAQFNWPTALLAQELENVKSLVAEVEGEITSFLSYRELPDYFEISILATKPSRQRSNLQVQLIQYLQALAAKQRKAILLEVHQENHGAKCLYQKLGFILLHSRQKYYLDKADALVLKWASNKAGC